MVYDSEWLEFCQIIYHMFGAGVINDLRGRGHFSQVTSNRTLKNKYDPTEGEFNFPIPSIPTLKKLDIGFPSEIPVGFVEQSLQLAEMKSKVKRNSSSVLMANWWHRDVKEIKKVIQICGV